MVELAPPKGCVSDARIDCARLLKSHGVDVVHIPDGSRGARMSALSLAVLIQQHASIETVLQYSCRDRNLLGTQSDLLGAHAMGVRNVMIVTGDVSHVGDYPDATAVFDVDSIGLTNVVSRLNHGLDIGGQAIGSPTSFHIGVQVNPGAEDLESEIRRFEHKVEAGAEFAVTKPVFDLDTFERLFKRIESARLPLISRPAAIRQRAECRIHGQRGAWRARAGRRARADAPRGQPRGRCGRRGGDCARGGARTEGHLAGASSSLPPPNTLRQRSKCSRGSSEVQSPNPNAQLGICCIVPGLGAGLWTEITRKSVVPTG